jgi:hypothetical protein
MGSEPGSFIHEAVLVSSALSQQLFLFRAVARVTRGRCYDHNFLRFLKIFGEKIGVFLKNQFMIKILPNLALFWVKKRQFFRWNFRRKYSKNHNIGPRLGERRSFILGSILKITKLTQIFVLIFSRKRLCINFNKNCLGLHFGRFFHKLIWSPWLSQNPPFHGLHKREQRSRF